MTFGGYDLQFAKKGASEKDITWSDQSANEAYWAINGKDVKFGDQALVSHHQQYILDNGMSLAMVPKKSFLAMVKTLYQKHGILCQPAQPLWGCVCNEEQYNALPNLKFNFI